MCLTPEAFSVYVPHRHGLMSLGRSTVTMPWQASHPSASLPQVSTISIMHHHHRAPSLPPVLWVPSSLDDLERRPPHHQCRCTHCLSAHRGSHRAHLCMWCLLTTAWCIVTPCWWIAINLQQHSRVPPPRNSLSAPAAPLWGITIKFLPSLLAPPPSYHLSMPDTLLLRHNHQLFTSTVGMTPIVTTSNSSECK